MFDYSSPKALLVSVVAFVLANGVSHTKQGDYKLSQGKSGLVPIGRKIEVPSSNGPKSVTVESLYSILAATKGWKQENCDLVTVAKSADLFVHLGPNGKRRWPIDCVSNGTARQKSTGFDAADFNGPIAAGF
jgi:hypothetical protein